MEKQMRYQMLALAKRYAKANNLSLATVSRRFHGTDTFLEDFKNGKVSITLRKWDEVMGRFEAAALHKNVVKKEVDAFKNRRKLSTARKVGATEE